MFHPMILMSDRTLLTELSSWVLGVEIEMKIGINIAVCIGKRLVGQLIAT